MFMVNRSMTTDNILSTKQTLHSACMQVLNERILRIQNAIKEAQQAANEETKSSSGDKYETTRAMMHLEIEKNSIQLQEATKQQRILSQIRIDQINNRIENGSLVVSNQETFYLAVSIGKIVIDDKPYVCISTASPIGQLLLKQNSGYEFTFQGKVYKVMEVY